MNRALIRSLAVLAVLFPVFMKCRNDGESPLFALMEEPRSHPGIYFSRPDGRGGPYEYFRARDEIIHSIDRASKRIEVWCYGLDEPALIFALARAQMRGVELSITGSPDEDYSAARRAGLSLNIRAKTGIQHVKLILIDRRVLVTGTGNFTESCLFHNNNAYIIMEIPAETAAKIAGSLIYEDTPSRRIELPFSGIMLISPSRGELIQSKIVESILRARYRIRYMIFSHTDPVISAALLFASLRGVIIEGIYDDESGRERFPADSQGALILAKAPVNYLLYLDGNRARFESGPGLYHGGHLHHKTLIIDDATVLTGSYNWSRSARDTNLENWMEFRNPLFVRAFNDEFDRIKNHALPFYSGYHPSSPPPILTVRSDRICWDGAAPLHGFTLFSGRGLYFRAESFPASPLNSGCDLFSEHQSISAGLMRGSTHLIEPDGENGVPAGSLFSFEFIRDRSHKTAPPCEQARECRVEVPLRASTASGWIWTDGGSRYTHIRRWDSSGLHGEEALQRISANFYRFTSGPGDAILFLRDEEGIYHAACIQSGSLLQGPVKYFKESFEWESNREWRCVQGE